MRNDIFCSEMVRLGFICLQARLHALVVLHWFSRKYFIRQSSDNGVHISRFGSRLQGLVVTLWTTCHSLSTDFSFSLSCVVQKNVSCQRLLVTRWMAHFSDSETWPQKTCNFAKHRIQFWMQLSLSGQLTTEKYVFQTCNTSAEKTTKFHVYGLGFEVFLVNSSLPFSVHHIRTRFVERLRNHFLRPLYPFVSLAFIDAVNLWEGCDFVLIKACPSNLSG